MGEARMDVIDSEIGHLGYHESESYGLVWKVKDLSSELRACVANTALVLCRNRGIKHWPRLSRQPWAVASRNMPEVMI